MDKKKGKKPPKNSQKKSSKKTTAIVKLENQIKEMESVIKDLTDTKGKLSITETPFTKNQLMKILQRTPAKYIKQRKGRGGKMVDYVPGVYMKKCANYTFGWLWSSDVLREKEYADKFGKVISVCSLVKVTVNEYDKKTGVRELIHKTSWGKSNVAYLKNDSTKPVDIGDEWKSSVTDGVKKCLSDMGFASDVYGKNEFKEIQREENPIKDVTPKPVKKSAIDDSLNFTIAGLNTYGWSRDNTNRVIEKTFGKGKVLEKLSDDEKTKLMKLLDVNLKKLKKQEKK